MLSPADGRAGAGQRVLNLAHAVSQAGVAVRLIRPARSHKTLAERCSELRQRWQAELPRWVYVEVPEPESESWRLVAKQCDIPLVTTWHPIAWMSPTGQQSELERYLHAFLVDCRQVLAETPDIRRALSALGHLDSTVVSNGVDGQRFHPRLRSQSLRQQWGAGPATVVVLHVGRLEPQKNLALLARAFLAVKAVDPNAILVCIGAGTGRDQLVAAVPGLVLPGFLEGAALAEAYAASDLFLFPSLDDPYGNVVLEAAASGLAVVAFDRAAASLCLQKAAALVPVENESSYLDTVRRLVTDHEARIAMGIQARAAAERSPWQATVAAFITALQRAEQVPPRRSLPGVTPVAVSVSAHLPEEHADEPFATFRQLAARGHRIRWQDSADDMVTCDQRQIGLHALTGTLPPPDARGAWSHRTELAEARLLAWVAGNPPLLQPLRIAAVLDAPNAVSGTAQRFCHLVAGLRRLGHPVQIQALTADTKAPVPPTDPHLQVRRRTHLTEHFLQTWRDDRPDLVHVELLDAFGACAGDAASILGIPWTLTWHPLDHLVQETSVNGVTSSLIQLASRATGVIAESESQVGDLLAHGLSVAGIVGNGVDTQRFSPLHRSRELREAWQCQTAVLAVDHLLAAENVVELIPIAQALRDIPGARLIVVGDGPERPALMTALPEVMWLGSVADDALAAIYASADLFITTNRRPGDDLIVLEALASGLPVIGYDQGVVAELVQHRKNGWKVPLHDCLNSLLYLAVHTPRALQTVTILNDYTWHLQANRLATIFRHLISQ